MNLPPATILLVDDKVENLVALESILSDPGYALVRAQSGEEALLAMLQGDFAAIVLDVKMPGMSGIELAKVIRARRKTQSIPILFLTAHADESEVAGYEAGGVDFLTKPVHPGILRSKVAVFAELFRKSRALKTEIEERRLAEERVRQLNQELASRVDELRLLNGELESFSYTVSHDLRAPLRQIAGFVRLLGQAAGTGLDSKAADYLPLIGDATVRMGQLIDNLLDFSRLGRASLVCAEVELRPLVEEVQGELLSGAEARVIEWKLGALPVVWGDSRMLRQVFINLLDNAIKFSRQQPRARISIDCDTFPSEHVCSVRDNGVGFDAEYAGKLFGVFQRLHDDGEFEGTGIGLATVRRIVQRHGGRTWAESEPGQGASFYFSLPRH